MAAQEKALQKVVSRLTQLRAEFGPEERSMLDQIVLGDTPEVIAHAATLDAIVPARLEFDEEAVAYRVAEF